MVQTAWNIEGKTAGNEPVPLDKARQLQAAIGARYPGIIAVNPYLL